MATEELHRCPECRGTGQVLLLFSWATCRTCDGTGRIEEDDEDLEDTGEFEAIRDDRESGCEEGSKASSCCDPEDGPGYFDDGLEFDDDCVFGYGDGDNDGWGSGDDAS